MKNRFVAIGIFCLLTILCQTAAGASPALIMDLQYWFAPDHIQTILFFNQAVQPSYHYRSNPSRFVLEIKDCQDIRGDQMLPVNDDILQRIRVQRLSSGTTQVVFDLSKQVEATVLTLPPVNGQPDRVIVNLFNVAYEEQNQQREIERTRVLAQLRQNRYHIVVLDPGHGGRDSGASGRSGLTEKEVVLDLARRIQKIIAAQAPNIQVSLTRDRDYFLSLQKRIEIAEEYNADLFVSLHVNANPSSKAHGFSVYTLSEEATDEAARKLAEKENASDLLFNGIATPIPQEDPLLTFVLADLSATATLQNSLEFGRIALNTTITNLSPYKISREGLKRANFTVLRTAAMPAALVEACYISNSKEEALLKQNEFRQKIADSLAASIIDYLKKMNGPSSTYVARSETQLTSRAGGILDNKIHVVKSGESLSVIAGKYKVDLTLLCQVNNIASADVIYAGQRLWIP